MEENWAVVMDAVQGSGTLGLFVILKGSRAQTLLLPLWSVKTIHSCIFKFSVTLKLFDLKLYVFKSKNEI